MQLWRLHGPARVLTAALYPHVEGTELRVFFEPERSADVLERQVGDPAALGRRAAVVREGLLDKGWVELENGSRAWPTRFVLPRRRGIVAAVSVASGLALWWWRRGRTGQEPVSP